MAQQMLHMYLGYTFMIGTGSRLMTNTRDMLGKYYFKNALSWISKLMRIQHRTSTQQMYKHYKRPSLNDQTVLGRR